ncbi:MAG TPA: hypothetical protein VLH08_02360, partial [Acidobacteriota bacterium]|nr:hypothetical protein [Acidobacteriota bacterium]
GAILMACCMYHILFISHVPWSNCMSPFFAALSILSFLKAAQNGKLYWFGVGGFFFGIALQTHPALITLALPIILICLFVGEARVRNRIWSYVPVIALAGGLLGYANMVIYNVHTHMGSVRFAMVYPTYAMERNPEVTSYIRNLKHTIELMLQLISGGAQVKAVYPFNWLSLALMIAGLLLLSGLVICLYRKSWVLPSLFLLPFLIVPIFNKSYEFCQFGRYLGFLLIPAYLLIGTAMISIFDFLRARNHLIALSFLITISALLIIAEADQLHKLSTELRSHNPSMIVFKATVKRLPTDVKQYPILIDHGTWKAMSLVAFLQTDGWLVSTPHLPKALQVEMRRLEKEKGSVTAIVSPNLLLNLMRSKSIDSCVGCIALVDEGRFIRSLLGKTLYLFVTAEKDVQPGQDPLLKVMRVLVTESNSRIRRSHSSEITAQLQQTCKIVTVQPIHRRDLICKGEKISDDDGSGRVPDGHPIQDIRD